MNFLAENQLTLRFSHEELATLVQFLGAETLLGLGEQPFDDLPAEQISQIRAAAERALLARGFLVLTPDNEVMVEATVLKVISFCLRCQHMVVFISRLADNNQPNVETYYVVPELAVHHFKPYCGLHDLNTIIPQPNFIQLILERLAGFISSTDDAVQFTLSQDSLSAAQEQAAHHKQAIAVTQLLTQNVPAPYAEIFAAALKQPDLRLLIHVVPSGGQPQTLTLLCSRQNCWLLHGFDSEETVRVELAPVDRIRAELQRLFANIQVEPLPAALSAVERPQ